MKFEKDKEIEESFIESLLFSTLVLGAVLLDVLLTPVEMFMSELKRRYTIKYNEKKAEQALKDFDYG